jgi:endo-1,4-beta-xylanase
VEIMILKPSNSTWHRWVIFILLLLVFFDFQLPAQLALGHDKWLGCNIGSYIPDSFDEYWNQVTPENASKWGSVEVARDVYSWNSLDMAYNYALDNGFPFRFHVLVWGKQQPGWLNSLSPEEQKEEVEEWIRLAGERYPDADYVEPVNEAIEWLPWDYYPSYYEAIGGAGDTGWDWVIWTFEKAREYFPNSKLYLNEYQLFGGNKSINTYLKIVDLLKERGLIDGVCEQGHFCENVALSRIQTILDKLAETGLPIQITEFDVNIKDDAQQLTKYQQLFPVMWEHPAVEGITMWGYHQSCMGWHPDAHLQCSDGSERPALTWLRDYMSTSGGRSGVESPGEFQLGQNYPNPFNPETTISYELNRADHVRLTVYDNLGREVAILVNEEQAPGQYRVTFNGCNYPSGLYLCTLTAGSSVRTMKMMMLK